MLFLMFQNKNSKFATKMFSRSDAGIFVAKGLTTIMVNNTIGVHLDLLNKLLVMYNTHFPNGSLPYTSSIYTNITFHVSTLYFNLI